jgi:hypothetical protein
MRAREAVPGSARPKQGDSNYLSVFEIFSPFLSDSSKSFIKLRPYCNLAAPGQKGYKQTIATINNNSLMNRSIHGDAHDEQR